MELQKVNGVSVDSKLDLSMMREGRTRQQGGSGTAGEARVRCVGRDARGEMCALALAPMTQFARLGRGARVKGLKLREAGQWSRVRREQDGRSQRVESVADVDCVYPSCVYVQASRVESSRGRCRCDDKDLPKRLEAVQSLVRSPASPGFERAGRLPPPALRGALAGKNGQVATYPSTCRKQEHAGRTIQSTRNTCSRRTPDRQRVSA